MTDRDIIKAELQNLKEVLETKADMCVGAGVMKVRSFANACSGALELLKEQEMIKKVYVVLRNSYNGEWYEDEDHEIDRFRGVFKTRELAEEFARNEINKLFKCITTGDLHIIVDYYMDSAHNARIVDGGMAIIFDGCYDQGYIRYNVTECDTDSKNPQYT